MTRLGPLLAALLIAGCTSQPQPAIEGLPPPLADTDFSRLPALLAGVQGGDVALSEGLPSRFWEPQLREQELLTKRTFDRRGHPFYADSPALEPGHAEALTALCAARASFAPYRAGKSCGEFHPDFCVEWKSDDAATSVLIGLECGEVEILGPAGELHCDLSNGAAQALRALLKGYAHQRPAGAN